MGRQVYESSANYKRAKLLIAELASPRHSKTMIKHEDNLKLLKIRAYVDREERITVKQYKALVHYCKVYNVKISNAIDFIID